MFHRWFLTSFPEPSEWFERRLAYGRSCAVWSCVGFIVGLGDRHGENILVDRVSGELVHVDFDCLFDKGKELKSPEVVPFRLTPNIADAFGISGPEGLFRKSAEMCMQVLRENQETLMNVLDPFIHDPLVEWKEKNAAAPHIIMANIKLKLQGQEKKDSLPLSVPGQIHQLIQEASSEANLCKMYIGWMSWFYCPILVLS